MPEFPSHIPVPGKRIVFTVVPKPFVESGQELAVVDAFVTSRRIAPDDPNQATITTTDPDYRILVLDADGNWWCHPTDAMSIQEQVEIRGIHVAD